MLNPIQKLKLLQLATTYGVNIIHYEPGYVHILLNEWDTHDLLFRRVLRDIKEVTFVKSVIIDDVRKTVSIYFNENILNNKEAVNMLYAKLMNYI